MYVARGLAVLALTALIVTGAASGSVAASPQPSPACPVCGDDYSRMWGDEEWAPPGDQRLTVTAHGNGSATWVATLRWDDPGEAPAPGEEADVESAARAALDGSLYLSDHEALVVEAGDGEATIRWRTRGVVDEKFGHGVLRPFHGEGVEQRLFVNVDELVVRAPAGQVITNDPAVGTVAENGTALTVDGPQRDVEDFYVVFGEERDAVASATTTLAIGYFIWPMAAGNLLRIVVLPLAVFGLGLGALHAAGRRRSADPERIHVYGGVATATAGLVVGVAATDDVLFGSLFTVPAVVGSLAALVAFGYAAADGTRWLLAATAAAVPAIGLAPLVADAWPFVTFGSLYFVAVLAYTGLAAGVVVLGAPCFLFGLALGRRRRSV